MSRLLDVVGVSYRVESRPIVDRATFSLDQGEVVALVGPNGAGKTTLVRAVAGELGYQEGRIGLGDAELRTLDPMEAARRRAVMSQATTVRFPFRAKDIVAMGRFSVDADQDADTEAVTRAMEITDTDSLADAFFPVLSAGEQARVHLARVLAQEAPLLVLDEPTAVLDVRHQRMVMRLLRVTAAADGGVLIVMHDLNLAAEFADRLVMVSAGAVVADGPPDEVLRPALLTEVYDQPMEVVPHPRGRGLLVIARDS